MIYYTTGSLRANPPTADERDPAVQDARFSLYQIFPMVRIGTSSDFSTSSKNKTSVHLSLMNQATTYFSQRYSPFVRGTRSSFLSRACLHEATVVSAKNVFSLRYASVSSVVRFRFTEAPVHRFSVETCLQRTFSGCKSKPPIFLGS